eukprot:7387907-Prymnesium_polylepis.1
MDAIVDSIMARIPQDRRLRASRGSRSTRTKSNLASIFSGQNEETVAVPAGESRSMRSTQELYT